MRIQPIAPFTSGTAWRVMSIGVRPVLIRRWRGAAAEVSPRNGELIGTATGCTRAWGISVNLVAIGDLFAVEQDARIEFRRRQERDRSPTDRRRRREPKPGDLTAVEGALVSLSIALFAIMVMI